jgi:hypothetical protein
MRVSTNGKLIKRRRKLGTYASLGGLGVLALGMVASFRMQYVWVSLAALLVGFILAQYGNYNLRRWGRSPRPDQVLEEALKGFDDRYHFYTWTLATPFVLLSPQGIYSLTTRDQTGQITATGSQWHSKFSLSRILMVFAQEGLGNPTTEAQEQAGRLTSWIQQKLPEMTPNVQPVIIFIDERAQLNITDPTVPVLDAKGLKKWLRGPGKAATLKSADYKALETLFDARAEEASR